MAPRKHFPGRVAGGEAHHHRQEKHVPREQGIAKFQSHLEKKKEEGKQMLGSPEHYTACFCKACPLFRPSKSDLNGSNHEVSKFKKTQLDDAINFHLY